MITFNVIISEVASHYFTDMYHLFKVKLDNTLTEVNISIYPLGKVIPNK